jgi:hypothetical protein
MNSAPTWLAYVTLGIALLGAFLGVVNTWQALKRDRVRLRVTPSHAIQIPSGRDLFAIEVVNLSAFPVTIVEVGFILDGARGKLPRRMMVTRPSFADDGPWPRRLEGRASVSAYFNPNDLPRGAGRVTEAYARTQCGTLMLGVGDSLKSLREHLGQR